MPLATDFAPAERGESSELERQISVFAASPLVQFIDYMPDIVVVLNRYRQIIYANQTAQTMLDTTDAATVYGMRTGELFDCIHSDENEGGCGTTVFCSECGSIKAILNSLRGQADIQECQITQKKTGDAIVMRIWTHPVTVHDEVYTIFIATDIGNEKRREVLERVFLHDIMNTVGNIRSFAEILREASEADAEEFRGLIWDLSQRLVDEINSHRQLVAAENNDLTVHLESFDSLELVNSLGNYYRRSDLGKDYTITIDPDSVSLSITSDKTILSRVIGNMIKNALEASIPGDVITLKVQADGDTVRFCVHNPGYIPEPVQLQIFKRSFSTKGTGRGLGTYGMRLLSERYLKGTVSFTSTESEGTTFMGRYPLAIR